MGIAEDTLELKRATEAHHEWERRRAAKSAQEQWDNHADKLKQGVSEAGKGMLNSVFKLATDWRSPQAVMHIVTMASGYFQFISALAAKNHHYSGASKDDETPRKTGSIGATYAAQAAPASTEATTAASTSPRPATRSPGSGQMPGISSIAAGPATM